MITRELFDFLMGVGEIDGTSFGELNDGLPGAFWWRALLRVAERETARFDTERNATLERENAALHGELDEQVVYAIGKEVADGCAYKPGSDNHTRVWLAAQLGVRAYHKHLTDPARNALGGQP